MSSKDKKESPTEKKAAPIAADLAVERRGAEIWVRLEFANVSRETQWLDAVNGCLKGYVDNDVFGISTGDDDKVRYVGPRVYRQPTAPSDLVALAPDESKAVELRLDEVYAFAAKGRCVISYRAYHGDADKGGLLLVRSNGVDFSLG